MRTLPDRRLGPGLDELVDPLDRTKPDRTGGPAERVDDDQLDLIARFRLLLKPVDQPVEVRLRTRGNKRDRDLHARLDYSNRKREVQHVRTIPGAISTSRSNR